MSILCIVIYQESTLIVASYDTWTSQNRPFHKLLLVQPAWKHLFRLHLNRCFALFLPVFWNFSIWKVAVIRKLMEIRKRQLWHFRKYRKVTWSMATSQRLSSRMSEVANLGARQCIFCIIFGKNPNTCNKINMWLFQTILEIFGELLIITVAATV